MRKFSHIVDLTFSVVPYIVLKDIGCRDVDRSLGTLSYIVQEIDEIQMKFDVNNGNLRVICKYVYYGVMRVYIRVVSLIILFSDMALLFLLSFLLSFAY